MEDVNGVVIGEIKHRVTLCYTAEDRNDGRLPGEPINWLTEWITTDVLVKQWGANKLQELKDDCFSGYDFLRLYPSPAFEVRIK